MLIKYMQASATELTARDFIAIISLSLTGRCTSLSQTQHQLAHTLLVIVFSQYSQHMPPLLGHFWFVVLFGEWLFCWREESHTAHY